MAKSKLVIQVPASKKQIAANKKEAEIAQLEASLAMLKKVTEEVVRESKTEETRLKGEIARLKRAK